MSYQWNFYKCNDITNVTSFSNIVFDIYIDGFGKDEIIEIERTRNEWVNNRLGNSTYIGLLNDNSNNIGYTFLTIPNDTFDGKKIIWFDSFCIRKKFQGNIFSKSLFSNITNIFSNFTIGYYGARSQNPLIFRLLDSKGHGLCYPFDKYFSNNFMEFLIKNVEEVRTPFERNKLDLKTGICKSIYRSGRLGDYKINIQRTKVAHYEDFLTNLNFDRQNGDSLIIIKELFDGN